MRLREPRLLGAGRERLAVARPGARAVTDEPGSTVARLAGGEPRRATGALVTEAARDGDAARSRS